MTEKTKTFAVSPLWFLCLVSIWLGYFLGWLDRFPNLFSILYFDHGINVITYITVFGVLLWLCQYYCMRYLKVVILFLVVLSLLFPLITSSVFLTVRIENLLDTPIHVVSVDLHNNRSRMVSVPSKTNRIVVLTEGESTEKAKGNGYYILAYDISGEIYYHKYLNKDELERVHEIQIKDSSIKEEHPSG